LNKNGIKEERKEKFDQVSNSIHIDENIKNALNKESSDIKKISFSIDLNFIRHESKEQFKIINNKNVFLLSWKAN